MVKIATPELKSPKPAPIGLSSRWKIALALLALAIAVLTLDIFTYPILNSPSDLDGNRGLNGIWLRFYWYFNRHSQAETEAMYGRLRDGQFKYAYFHVLRTRSDGALKHKMLDRARKITDGVHAAVPGVKVIAWVYVPSKYGQAEGVDLSVLANRRRLIDTAEWLVNDCDFDGVQWDYEFCPNNDPDFPLLLKETREAIGSAKILSIATPMWYPNTLWGWDDAYFKSVAPHCDQIAVMCYDSFFYLPRSYVWLVKEQVVHVTRAVFEASPGTRVLLGIPVYDGGTLGHITHTENIRTALQGVKEGLADGDSRPQVFDGVAPFADYTMDNSEWRQYRRWWLKAK